MLETYLPELSAFNGLLLVIGILAYLLWHSRISLKEARKNDGRNSKGQYVGKKKTKKKKK